MEEEVAAAEVGRQHGRTKEGGAKLEGAAGAGAVKEQDKDADGDTAADDEKDNDDDDEGQKETGAQTKKW